MDEITKQIILEKTRASIEDYKTHADELLKMINIHFANEEDRFRNIAILTIQRYYSGLISLSTLMKEYKFYKPIEFTYALILRTLILDFITVEYLKSQYELGQDEFNEALKGINYISAKDSNRFCDNVEKDKEGFRSFIAKNIFPENFNIDETTGESKLIKSDKIAPRKMAEFFKDKKEAYAYDAYDLYSQFSLIEHFNNLTFGAVQGDDKSDLKNIIWSIFYIFHGHDRCLEILDFFPKHAPEIVKKRDYFMELVNDM